MIQFSYYALIILSPQLSKARANEQANTPCSAKTATKSNAQRINLSAHIRAIHSLLEAGTKRFAQARYQL